jgi:RNA polymerase sigma-70 factor (ECF subfamily)
MQDGDSHEEGARDLAEAGRHGEAATLLLQHHGPGVLGYLHALSSSDDEAEELFAEVCERLWRHMPRLEWSGSLRTWMYVTARHLLVDTRRRDHRRKAVPLSSVPELVAAVRSSTAVYRRTETKTNLHRVREQLDPDDRSLLILRVDRGMSWDEVARVMASEDADDEELGRVASRMRKRFERIKGRIRALLAVD